MAASARITYTPSAVGGVHLKLATQYAILAQQEIAHAKNIADSVTGGGVTPANLEGSAEFGALTGQGSSLYTAISNFSANLATVTAAQLAALDQGS